MSWGNARSHRDRNRRESKGARTLKLGLLGLLAAGVVALTIISIGSVRSAADPTATAGPIPTFGTTRVPPPAVKFFGDSYTGGSDMGGVDETGWPAIACDSLGCTDSVESTSGAGFINGEADGRGLNNALDATRANSLSNVVVIAAGANDYRYTSEENAAAADAFIARVQSRWPEAKLVIIGPFWRNDDPSDVLVDLDEHLEGLAAEIGAPFASPIQQGWLTGENARFIGTDNVHPDDEGHVFIATQLIPLLEQAGARRAPAV
jgi:lysophospholipase L1-like esterase